MRRRDGNKQNGVYSDVNSQVTLNVRNLSLSLSLSDANEEGRALADSTSTTSAARQMALLLALLETP